MQHESHTRQIHSAVDEGWVQGGSFLNSVLAGTILGLLGDHWLGTDPWLVVIGAILGFYSGFMTMWSHSKTMEDHPRGR